MSPYPKDGVVLLLELLMQSQEFQIIAGAGVTVDEMKKVQID